MNFPEKWTGDIVKIMHLNDISQSELGEEMGVSREIVCKTLRGKYNMANGEERFTSAVNTILTKRNKI